MMQGCTTHAKIMQTCLLYIEISYITGSKKHKCDIQRTGFLDEENKSVQRSCIF